MKLAFRVALAHALAGAAARLDGTGLSLRFMQSAVKMAVKSEGGQVLFPVPIDFDWKTMLAHNEKQRQVWLAEVKKHKVDDSKEKSI